MPRRRSRRRTRSLGAFDVAKVKELALRRVDVAGIRVPMVVLVAGGAYGLLILGRMARARFTEADGTKEVADEQGTYSTGEGKCYKIEDQYNLPIGCGTVGVIGYRKDGFGKVESKNIEIRELPGYPGHYLQSKPIDTYSAFLRMKAGAEAAGQKITLNSSFRTMGKQRALYAKYLKGQGALASYPGTSPHQMARAVDIQTGGGSLPIYQWLVDNCQRFGFFRTVKSETWHYHYFPEKDPFLKR